MKRFSLLNMLIGIGIGMVLTSIINIIFISGELEVYNHYKDNVIKPPSEEINQKDEERSKDSSNYYKQEDINENEIKEIFIEKGMDSIEIAELLKKEKIIANADDFIKKTHELNLAKELKYGLKKIPKGSTIEEILKILIEIP